MSRRWQFKHRDSIDRADELKLNFIEMFLRVTDLISCRWNANRLARFLIVGFMSSARMDGLAGSTAKMLAGKSRPYLGHQS